MNDLRQALTDVNDWVSKPHREDTIRAEEIAKWYQEGVKAEREACVKICEEVLSEYYGSDLQSAAARCAYLISTRGEQDD